MFCHKPALAVPSVNCFYNQLGCCLILWTVLLCRLTNSVCPPALLSTSSMSCTSHLLMSVRHRMPRPVRKCALEGTSGWKLSIYHVTEILIQGRASSGFNYLAWAWPWQTLCHLRQVSQPLCLWCMYENMTMKIFPLLKTAFRVEWTKWCEVLRTEPVMWQPSHRCCLLLAIDIPWFLERKVPWSQNFSCCSL